MSTAQRTEGSTAIQMVERAAIGTLPPAVQQQLELRKLTNQIAGKLAELNWGKSLDDPTRRAIADWGQRFRIDVTTEIHVLGGNVYIAAPFYLRKLGEMIAAGLVEYAYADHVEDDPRLAQLGPEGEGEASRRLRQRLMHGIPDKAAGAVVFRVKLYSMDREVTGTKWCGNGTRKNDPVGEQFPIESSESRAARRAMRLLTSHVPKNVEDEIIDVEGSAETLSERVAQGRAEVKEREAFARIEPKPIAAPADPADPYSVSATREREAVREPVRDVPAPVAVAAAPAPVPQSVEQPALALDAAPSRPDPAPTPTEPKRTAAVRMPFTMGKATVGTPLDLVVTKDLAEAREWAMRNSADKFSEFIEHAGIELDERRFAEREGAA